ncbi:MAG: hypothetical protein JWL81_1089, partial [Verrucomicrobiales bacterium]|nr:hypothetical protein [Verrucomicrobiales bacterium]
MQSKDVPLQILDRESILLDNGEYACYYIGAA